ncbi:MAG: PqqD family protein [Firmicutes bacterium HGW-Firmicutes-14]|nr:MAG: PqqD family protein [Firmicutes bacterium HGW-Firmicutes-14]
MMDSGNIRKNPKLITRITDGEAVIMHPDLGKVLSLNEVGSFIWEMADGSRNREQLLDAVCSEFDVDREQAAGDLDEFLDTLREKDLLED